jgi:hypothetical protein
MNNGDGKAAGKIHSHFCHDCDKDYQCRITEPCHLDTAEFCLRHFLERMKNGMDIDGGSGSLQTQGKP